MWYFTYITDLTSQPHHLVPYFWHPSEKWMVLVVFVYESEVFIPPHVAFHFWAQPLQNPVHVQMYKQNLKFGWNGLKNTLNFTLIKVTMLTFSLFYRCVNGDTPLDLARQRNHTQCMQLLENYIPPPCHFVQSTWLHSSVDRHVSTHHSHSSKSSCLR